MRDSQQRGRGRLRALAADHRERGEMIADERGRFERLADPAAAPVVVASFNLFQTPADLADELAGEFTTWGRVLEPSAGLGRLIEAAKRRGAADITAVDISADCCRVVRPMVGATHQADFLGLTVDDLGPFDSIVMNPPFKNGADIKHILHAVTMLAPGGRLVALCYDGPRQDRDLRPIASKWKRLGQRFKCEGTSAGVCLFVLDQAR